MSYEERVRALHSFEDTLNRVLPLIAQLDQRQKEIAIARIGDRIESGNALIDPDSAFFTAKLIQACSDVEAEGGIKKSRFRKLLKRPRKKDLAEPLSRSIWEAEKEVADKENEKNEKRYKKEVYEYKRILKEWRSDVDSMSYIKRFLFAPPPPKSPTRPFFNPRPSYAGVRERVIQNTTEQELIIEFLAFLKYPKIKGKNNYYERGNLERRLSGLV